MKKKIILLCILTSGILKPQIDQTILKQYLPDNPVILDAGAHNGSSSIQLINIWQAATIYAFEPVPNLFNLLKKNTNPYNQIHSFQVALGEKNEQKTIFISQGRGDGSSSLLAPTGHLTEFPDVKFPQKATVNVTTLDAWAKKNNVSYIDFLWLDLQGMEYQVLKNSPEILSTVRVIVTEVNFKPLYNGCTLYSTIKSFLEEQGFTEILMKKEHPTFGDSVFVRNELLTSNKE